MQDWLKRSIKTFVQAFFGVIVAQSAAIVAGLANLCDWKDWLLPIISAAVAAGISAVWNCILEASARKEAQRQLEEFQNLNDES